MEPAQKAAHLAGKKHRSVWLVDASGKFQEQLAVDVAFATGVGLAGRWQADSERRDSVVVVIGAGEKPRSLRR